MSGEWLHGVVDFIALPFEMYVWLKTVFLCHQMSRLTLQHTYQLDPGRLTHPHTWNSLKSRREDAFPQSCAACRCGLVMVDLQTWLNRSNADWKLDYMSFSFLVVKVSIATYTFKRGAVYLFNDYGKHITLVTIAASLTSSSSSTNISIPVLGRVGLRTCW